MKHSLADAVVQEVSIHVGNARGTESVDDAKRRARQMRWAWESERFIFSANFQLFIDDILGIEG